MADYTAFATPCENYEVGDVVLAQTEYTSDYFLAEILDVPDDDDEGGMYCVGFFGATPKYIASSLIAGVPRMLAYLEGGVLHDVQGPSQLASVDFHLADGDTATDGDGAARTYHLKRLDEYNKLDERDDLADLW